MKHGQNDRKEHEGPWKVCRRTESRKVDEGRDLTRERRPGSSLQQRLIGCSFSLGDEIVKESGTGVNNKGGTFNSHKLCDTQTNKRKKIINIRTN